MTDARMRGRRAVRVIASLALAVSCWGASPAEETRGNPFIPGYFADPSIIRHEGEWFVYATIDPWGGDTLGLWRSRDFRHWVFSAPNWPTKEAAKSPTSGKSKVWAPSVVRGRGGQFWMYVSVGNEIWVGTAPHPAGPWRDANGGKPLIPAAAHPGWDGKDESLCKMFGMNWFEELRSALLLVPSIPARVERNVLINPRHPDAARITYDLPEPVWWDERLYG